MVLVALSAAAGIILGFLIGLGETSSVKVLRIICVAYVNFVRGIPLLVIIFFIYFGAPLVVPSMAADAFTSALVALTVYAAAYIAEIIRGSISAVAIGQFEAALAVGLGYVSRMRYVILPQAMRLVVAPLISFLIVLIKESALVSVIGFVDLMKAAANVSASTQEPLIVYSITAVIYILLCLALSLVGRRYERSIDPSRSRAKRSHLSPTSRSVA